MQLKEEFRSYDTLRREHDGQIVQIATEAGLRIAPDQWSSLLYGDTAHKSHMQSIIDKLQTPQSFGQSIQELVVAIQRSGDPGHLSSLRVHLDQLALIDVGEDAAINHDWKSVLEGLTASCSVVSGLINFISNHVIKKHNSHGDENHQNSTANSRYKTSMCRYVPNYIFFCFFFSYKLILLLFFFKFTGICLCMVAVQEAKIVPLPIQLLK